MHQPCLRCGTTTSRHFREHRAKVCERCRPDYEYERNGRACFGCQVLKLPDDFPIANPHTLRPRRLAYCCACVERYGKRIAAGTSLTQVAREENVARRTLEVLYRLYRNNHPDAPPVSRWKSTRLNSRGQMVRRCNGPCGRELVVKENFYVSHPELSEDSPQRWDYACKRCRSQASSEYNRAKRLSGDPSFFARRREAQKRWVLRNPEKYAEARRRYIERKKRGEVVPLHARSYDHDHPRVDRAPFLAWVEETLPKYPGVTEFSDLIGIPARTLLRLRSDGGKWIELDTVDRALQREGGTMLIELYPTLYQEDNQEAA
jgi:hypothetical protein